MHAAATTWLFDWKIAWFCRYTDIQGMVSRSMSLLPIAHFTSVQIKNKVHRITLQKDTLSTLMQSTNTPKCFEGCSWYLASHWPEVLHPVCEFACVNQMRKQAVFFGWLLWAACERLCWYCRINEYVIQCLAGSTHRQCFLRKEEPLVDAHFNLFCQCTLTL